MKRNTLFAFLLWAFCSVATNAFAQNTQSAINNIQDDDIFYHTVERGQTVYSIAKMYDVKVEDIYRLNIDSNEAIKAGDRLKIPQKKSVKTPAEAEPENGSAYIFHTIQARETLYGVSKKYGVSGESIVEANPGLSHASFSIGKTIRIPAGKKQKPSTEIVETQKGAKEIYYTVPARETMYNICRTFKTSEKELLKLNPELAGGLRRGMTLRIPFRINEKDIPMDTEPDAGEINAMLNAKRGIKSVYTAKIALMLPYNAENRQTNTAGNRFAEYYEGMLLAVDSLRNLGYSTELFVYDIGDNTSTLRKILKDEGQKLKDVNLIIGGVSSEQIKLIADFAQSNKTKYVIPFTSRNDEVLNNAFIFQVNTPQSLLYANAVYAGANLFAKHNIIFLDTKDKDDQTEFINEFKRDLKERNISCKNAVYDAENFPANMEALLSTDKPNVIMPISSSLDALAKIKNVLRVLAETKPEYRISLFGYPVWQTYTKDCLDDFHALDTYIYSLYYADNMSPNVKTFYENYKNWYSNNPMSTFPKYGMLGFDTGMFFFGALQNYGVNFENNLSEIKYKSLQTGFNFERVNNWGGYINTNIYIIHYNKDYTITRSDFK
jgi:LysM repeat protein/ABC-type branched-subunit amino acid transport system substrate-binding protein